MTRLQSTGVYGLVAAPIVPATGDGKPYGTRAGLLREENAGSSAGAIEIRAMRMVAAASIVCFMVVSATVDVAASFVGGQSPFRSVPTR